MKFLALLIILLFNVFLYFLLMFQKIQQLCLWPSLEFDFSSYTFLANRSSAWRTGFGEKYALNFFFWKVLRSKLFFFHFALLLRQSAESYMYKMLSDNGCLARSGGNFMADCTRFGALQRKCSSINKGNVSLLLWLFHYLNRKGQ